MRTSLQAERLDDDFRNRTQHRAELKQAWVRGDYVGTADDRVLGLIMPPTTKVVRRSTSSLMSSEA